jgi:hypothetical protein
MTPSNTYQFVRAFKTPFLGMRQGDASKPNRSTILWITMARYTTAGALFEFLINFI